MKSLKLHTGSVVDICEDDIILKTLIQGKVNCPGREDKDDPFFICDLGDVVKKWKRFLKNLPRVEPFYAVKCNPDPNVIGLLAKLGANFDCASKNEIKQILDAGVAPERIIFANPCKQTSFIKYAATNKVNLVTFDNLPELHKMKQHHPNCDLLIRIKVDDSMSLCKYSLRDGIYDLGLKLAHTSKENGTSQDVDVKNQFGVKFGVCLTQTKELLEAAKKLNLNVVGVSFHVGSGCYNASLFYDAVEAAYKVFQEGADVGFKFNILDVGGGFPGVDNVQVTFEETAEALNMGFEKYFPEKDGVRIIAEPGRYFVASAFTSVCNITSVREVQSSKQGVDGYMYYLNDGVYGSFNCILFDHHNPTGEALFGNESDKLYRCSLWGPTCDSMDCISKDSMMPKLNIGDWVSFENMGAYTIAAGSKFNGFKQPIVLYMCRNQFASYIANKDETHHDVAVVQKKLVAKQISNHFVSGMKSVQLN